MSKALRSSDTIGSVRIATLIAFLLAPSLGRAAPSEKLPSNPISLGVTFHVASHDAAPVVPKPWINAQLNRANTIFAPAGIRFSIAETKPLSEKFARVMRRKQRHALGQYFERGTIHCFITGHLQDVDEPDTIRRGVHWTSKTFEDAHYIILAAYAKQNVLAHELGHYLGHRRHTNEPDNLMSYIRTGKRIPFLTPKQVVSVRRRAKHYLESKELNPLPSR